jgi:hypothetical protein
MPLRKPKAVDRKLEQVTENLLDEMLENGPDTEGYAKNLDHLVKLNDVRQTTGGTALNPNNMALVAGNLLGILIIVAYEQKHVMTSKAKDLLLKSK